MRIVTNPGSNLDDDLASHLHVDLMPQRIVVDGIPHDTRSTIPLSKVDAWIQRSGQHPHVQGTTAADFVELLGGYAKQDPSILAVMTSRRIIGSHDAAVDAARQLTSKATPGSLQIEIVDSCVTDVGAGLITLLAVQARAAGLSVQATAAALRKAASGMASLVGVATLENLIRGGRANFLTGWVANFLEIRPLIAFVDGELKSVGRMKARADLGAKMKEQLLERFSPGTPCWLGISHGDDEVRANAVQSQLVDTFHPRLIFRRPLAPSIYLHLGRGAVYAVLMPISDLGFEPGNPDIGNS